MGAGRAPSFGASATSWIKGYGYAGTGHWSYKWFNPLSKVTARSIIKVRFG